MARMSKIKLKRIENAASRQVTFCSRRGGLLRKAHELSVMCDAEVGVIVFSSKGKLCHYASSSMQSILERYVKNGRDAVSSDNNSSSDVNKSLSDIYAQTDQLTQFTEKLKDSQSNLIGGDLERLSLKELTLLEQQLYESLGCICAKKDELLLEHMEDFDMKGYMSKTMARK